MAYDATSITNTKRKVSRRKGLRPKSVAHSFEPAGAQHFEVSERDTSCDWLVSCREGGTSIDGFWVKKLTGFSDTFMISTGLLGVSNDSYCKSEERNNSHHREVLNPWYMVHAELDPDDDVVIDDLVIPSNPALYSISTTAYESNQCTSFALCQMDLL